MLRKKIRILRPEFQMKESLCFGCRKGAVMKREYDPTIKATLILDDSDRIRGINYLDEYREMENLRDKEASVAYIRSTADKLNIPPDTLHTLEQRVSYLEPKEKGVEYRYDKMKTLFDSATYGYRQTYLNIPVWGAGITVTVKQAPTRVVSATNTSEYDVDASMPSAEAIEWYRQLFSTGEKVEFAPSGPKAVLSEESGIDGSEMLSKILGRGVKSAKKGEKEKEHERPVLIRGRFFIYRYDPKRRISDRQYRMSSENIEADTSIYEEQPLCGRPPTLPLPPVAKTVREYSWYLVAELVFRYPYEGGRMNWRILVDVGTNSVLYLRALSSGANGLVFNYDPITSTGTTTNTPEKSNAVLNPHRSSVTLQNLDAPVGGIQSLSGTWATLTEESDPNIPPPTETAGNDFDYDVRTNDFAAVNAYYHVDRFFRLVENLGFTLGTYFDGTSFPVEVDHRGLGNVVNAHCVGDGDGIDHTCFALADTSDTTNPIGIAVDWRVILHELGGHGILHDHVGGPNFGFSHSAGDSFAVILNDYLSEWHNGAALDRFLLAPFVPSVPRRSDRDVASGWGWGGTYDTGGYNSEQILSTTMFRAYRAIGGDSTSVTRREFAARCMAYLMLRAVGTLTPTSNPASAAQFLAALLTADAGNWVSEGVYGGAYSKVLTWAFEKQNLNNGNPPDVDVYIDDGRGGEYEYMPVHWATTTIWNRRSADGLTAHQEPVLGETNYAYVKIKNRGTSVANNVVVKGYHCKPSAGVLWPNDLQPFTTAELSAGTLQPNNAEEKIVGPFEWTPVNNMWGHDCMLMIVSATGDPSNVDNFTAGEYVEDWRLVPNDNNVAQRNVAPVPGGGGLRGFMAGLQGKGFWVGNPGRSASLIKVEISLPPMLVERGWRIELNGISKDGSRLKAREERLVTFDVKAGVPFTRADAESANNRDIVVTATADGAIIGGMVYRIDPEIEMPYNERKEEDAAKECRDKAKELLECLNIPGDKVKCARIRKIAIDVQMKEDEGCCD